MKNTNSPEEQQNAQTKLIIFKSLPPSSKDSPRCMLRIPENAAVELLQAPQPTFPPIHKAHSATSSPFSLTPRIAKDKNFEFPDVMTRDREARATPDSQKSNSKNERRIKKHSSDKRISINILDLPEINKSPIRVQSEPDREYQGVITFQSLK